MDIRAYNRRAWDRHVERDDCPWTKAVSSATIAAARKGDFSVLLTENKPVPRNWFPEDLSGLDILALACGGGQQGPVFAALGADVTVYDNSPRQLTRDRQVAKREGLSNLRTVEGDAADLSAFYDQTFDLVFNPVSTVFMEEALPVWQEAYRVLRPGGMLLAGVMNPDYYLFDFYKAEEGILEVIHKLPYADADNPIERRKVMQHGWPLEFSHTLTDLLGGQCAAGFAIIDLYEDHHGDTIIGEVMPTYIATRSVKNC